MVRVHQGPPLNAGVAKLVDALDLGSSGVIHGGSSPFACTREESARTFIVLGLMININSRNGIDFFDVQRK